MISRNDIAALHALLPTGAVSALLELWDAWDRLAQSAMSRALPPTTESLRQRLHKAHAELERGRRRDVELARHLPAIAARLQSLAADAKEAADCGPPNANWEADPEIDWTGIER